MSVDLRVGGVGGQGFDSPHLHTSTSEALNIQRFFFWPKFIPGL